MLEESARSTPGSFSTPPSRSPTSFTKKTISKPNKRYVKLNDILKSLNINKDDYNNILVRRSIDAKWYYNLIH